MEKALQVTGFFVRHLLASIVSVLLPVILSTVVYFVLLLVAIIWDLYLGSPVALPLWLLIIGVISILYTALLIFPSISLAEIITRGLGRRQHLLQLPIALSIMAGIVFLGMYIISEISNVRDNVIVQILDSPHILILVLAVPLSIYWFVTKTAYLGFSLIQRLLRKLGITTEK